MTAPSEPNRSYQLTIVSSGADPVYPLQATMRVERDEAGQIQRLQWSDRLKTERWLVRSDVVKAASPSPDKQQFLATGSDQLTYRVTIETRPLAYHHEATVEAQHGGGDPGDLAGTWGADASKPNTPPSQQDGR